MKKIAVLCMLICIFTAVNTHNTKQLIAGFAAGILINQSVDFIRNKILPNMDNYNLYGNYGICRDQLTGQSKCAIALIGMYLAGYKEQKNGNLYARIIGVLAGLNFSAYLTKIFM